MLIEPRADAPLPLREQDVVGRLSPQEPVPGLLALLVAVAASAGENQIAEIVAAIRVRVIDVTLAPLAAQTLPAVRTPSVEVLPQSIDVARSWARISDR